MNLRRFAIDLTPLKVSAPFRAVFLSQLVSFIGSGITMVAIPYQIFQITHSNASVGLLGIAQLIPMLVSGFWGGAMADRWNRKKLVIWTEGIQALATMGLVYLSVTGNTVLWPLYVLAGTLAFLEGFHRPALSAILPLIVSKDLMPAVGALGGFRVTFSFVIAPSIAGVLIATVGLKWAYVIDVISYLISMALLARVAFPDYLRASEKNVVKSIIEGARYVLGQPVILASYLVDIAAMTLAYPFLLFPALSEMWGGARALGFLHSSVWMGALGATLLSGWVPKAKQHGKMITICALFWGLGICLAGLQSQLWAAMIFLAIAGATDMWSAIFRHTLWNQYIPENFRGRMGGIELLSFKSGPYLGGALMGFTAQTMGNGQAMVFGGLISMFAVVGIGYGLSSFWKYKSQF